MQKCERITKNENRFGLFQKNLWFPLILRTTLFIQDPVIYLSLGDVYQALDNEAKQVENYQQDAPMGDEGIQEFLKENGITW